jgi:hypothetical protein
LRKCSQSFESAKSGFQKLLAEHPVRQGLVLALERVEVVDHAGELALAGQLLLQPRAGQPVSRVVVAGLESIL